MGYAENHGSNAKLLERELSSSKNLLQLGMQFDNATIRHERNNRNHMIKQSMLRCFYDKMIVLGNTPRCSFLEFLDSLNPRM
jgi:hypothetical protein